MLARQGNERENSILSNQTSLAARFVTGGLRHAANAGIEVASEEQFAPALVGLGTRSPGQHLRSEPVRSGALAMHPERGLAYSRGKTNTVGVYAFDTVELGDGGSSAAGLRWEHYDAHVQGGRCGGRS